VAVRPGDAVAAGQLLLVIEAMKMEHNVAAPRAGTVATVACAVGERVEDGVELVTLED
jgi:3-methylcrotonyl-CoA carboxylase alpha subunit